MESLAGLTDQTPPPPARLADHEYLHVLRRPGMRPGRDPVSLHQADFTTADLLAAHFSKGDAEGGKYLLLAG